MRLLIFDIDGTLISAGGSAERAFEAAFESQFGITNVWGETQPHGRTDPDIVAEISQRALGRNMLPEEYLHLTNEYVRLLEIEIAGCPEYRILPGVEALCTELSKIPGVALGLETGNIETAARLKLQRGGLDGYFSFGAFGSDSSKREEIVSVAVERAKKLFKLSEIAPAQDVLVIGDAPQDVRAGRSFGAQTLAVATGKYSLEVLAKEEPTHLFENFLELERFLSLAV